jgi:hypothetical protein
MPLTMPLGVDSAASSRTPIGPGRRVCTSRAWCVCVCVCLRREVFGISIPPTPPCRPTNKHLKYIPRPCSVCPNLAHVGLQRARYSCPAAKAATRRRGETFPCSFLVSRVGSPIKLERHHCQLNAAPRRPKLELSLGPPTGMRSRDAGREAAGRRTNCHIGPASSPVPVSVSVPV